NGRVGTVVFGLIGFDLNKFCIVSDCPVVIALVKSQSPEVASPHHGHELGVLSPRRTTLRHLRTEAALRADRLFFTHLGVTLRAGLHIAVPPGYRQARCLLSLERGHRPMVVRCFAQALTIPSFVSTGARSSWLLLRPRQPGRCALKAARSATGKRRMGRPLRLPLAGMPRLSLRTPEGTQL